MNIVSSTPETLDVFIEKIHANQKEAITKSLENYDKQLYSSIDHKRFELIRIDERTILSSFGIIKYKRRYYYDNDMDEYVYLLDNQLQIPKSARMTNELIIKVLLYASEMTYDKVGKMIGNNEFILSKYTVWKIINKVTLEIKYDNEIIRGNEKIHVQVDEKYVGMVNSKNKKKYYTATIFAGIEKTKKGNKLLNKTYISSASMEEVKERINITLKERYKVKDDEVIYISGDLANYIQRLKEYITVCESIYVPDKFHVFKALKDLLPQFAIDEESINNECMQNTIITELNKFDDNVDARKLRSLIKKNPNCFKPYLDNKYYGCSQEGVNSHIYAPRFGKYANRFSPSTIEKLSLIREATALNAKIVIKHKKRKIPDLFDIDIYDGTGEIVRDILDTSAMKAQTAKMFNAIKYGRV